MEAFMAYQGYLLKVGNYIIPTNRYIRADSYKIASKIQDLDSYRDENGTLHRFALEKISEVIEFETPAMLTNITMTTLWNNIRKNYIVAKERKVRATYYVPETDSYATKTMYFADPEYSIYSNSEGIIRYNPLTIQLIGYGED